MKWMIVAYLVLNPIFFLVGVETRDAQQLFYQLSSVMIFACGMFVCNRAVKKNKLNIFLGILMLTFIFAWLRSMNGWLNALNLILGLMVYFTIIRTLKKEDTKLIIHTVMWVSIFAVIWLAFQMFGWDMCGTTIKNAGAKIPLCSFFRHNSSMGLYFAQSMPLTMGLSGLGLLFFVPMKFAECTGALLGGTIGVLFYLWFRKRIFFWLVLIPIVLGGTYYTINNETLRSLEQRVPVWKSAVQDIFRNPLGRGLDGYADPKKIGQWRYYQNSRTLEIIKITKTDKDQWVVDKKMEAKDFKWVFRLDHPHNEYIWLAYDVGFQGLIVLGFIMYFIWRRFWWSKKDAYTVALMAFFVSVALCCLTQFVFHLSRIGHMIPVCLGLFYLNTEEV